MSTKSYVRSTDCNGAIASHAGERSKLSVLQPAILSLLKFIVKLSAKSSIALKSKVKSHQGVDNDFILALVISYIMFIFCIKPQTEPFKVGIRRAIRFLVKTQ
ncbi:MULTISPECIES: hypothetical protein [Nostocales]|uniref:Uncharacterized protein n=2 Tax=Nostocales TaxID=1161 RepID=A0A0C1R496_9CYAN|nr:hypothetical protein [Tolypothrix bouteillei]KAF3886551.1 hypothetical protein DA73_0400014495 [Tolypothrix bouteillei VB521301]